MSLSLEKKRQKFGDLLFIPEIAIGKSLDFKAKAWSLM